MPLTKDQLMTDGRDALCAIGSATANFLSWWTSELRSLLPKQFRGYGERRVDIMLDDDVSDFAAFVSSTSNTQEYRRRRRLDQQNPVDIANLNRSHVVCLHFSLQDILTRHINVPTAAARSFGKLLEAEIDRWTPFQPAEVVTAFKRTEGVDPQSCRFELRLLPRTKLQDVLQRLGEGIRPTHVVLGSEDFVANIRVHRFKRTHWTFPAVLTVSIVVAASVDWMVAQTKVAQLRESYALDSKGMAEQKKLEERIVRIQAAINAATGQRSRRDTLAALSLVLPASDWLTEISIKGRAVTLRGCALDLGKLLKALEALVGAQDINIQGEVIYDPTIDRQRFSVTYLLKEA